MHNGHSRVVGEISSSEEAFVAKLYYFAYLSDEHVGRFLTAEYLCDGAVVGATTGRPPTPHPCIIDPSFVFDYIFDFVHDFVI